MDETAERIARRAYELWERAGRPFGEERHHWLEAERQIGMEMAGNKPGQPAQGGGDISPVEGGGTDQQVIETTARDVEVPGRSGASDEDIRKPHGTEKSGGRG